jgi:membrane protein implicated in regulation of membrane protease activity
VDVWQAVKPTALGIASWPDIPRGTDWKTGICTALGVRDPRQMWRRVLASVDSFADVEAPLLGAVEELIDFVTEPATAISLRPAQCHYVLMPAWLIWLIIAGVFTAGETVSGTFVLIMMSGGAVGAAGAAALGAPLILQVIVSLVVTTGLIWLARPVAVRHLHPGPAAITGSEALVGREAVVLTTVTRDGGRVRLNGGEWSARAKDPEQTLTAGTRVSVLAIEGATAVVWLDPLG